MRRPLLLSRRFGLSLPVPTGAILPRIPPGPAAMNPRLPDPLAPQELSHATSLPAEFYRGGDMLERDRTAVFARSWQLVGHEGALTGIGDHLVTEIAGLPIVVIRD